MSETKIGDPAETPIINEVCECGHMRKHHDVGPPGRPCLKCDCGGFRLPTEGSDERMKAEAEASVAVDQAEGEGARTVSRASDKARERRIIRTALNREATLLEELANDYIERHFNAKERDQLRAEAQVLRLAALRTTPSESVDALREALAKYERGMAMLDDAPYPDCDEVDVAHAVMKEARREALALSTEPKE